MQIASRMTVVATLLTVTGTVAAGGIYSSRAAFEADYPGLATEDFEGIAPAGGTADAPVISSDFTVASGTDEGVSYGVSSTISAPSDVLFQYNADDRLIFEFAVPVSAVGFQVSSVDFFDAVASGDAVISAYDASDAEIFSTTITTESTLSMDTFFGFAGTTEIARLEVGDAPGFAGYIVMDDLSYGIPSPGAGMLMLGAASPLALRRRR